MEIVTESNRVLRGVLSRPAFTATTLAAVCLLLAAAVLGASAVPARRAARMDPVTALRYE